VPVAEHHLDQRQPVDQLHETPPCPVQRPRAKQQQRRKRQAERIVGQHVGDGGNGARQKQGHQHQRVRIAAETERPRHDAYGACGDAKLGRHRDAVWQVDAAQVHEDGRIERRRDALGIGKHQIVRGKTVGGEIDPHLRPEHQRGYSRDDKGGDGSGSEHAPAAGRDQDHGK